MSDFNARKKREHEDAAAQALECKDYARAFSHTVQAANFTLNLAEQCEGKLARAYLDDANGLMEIAAKLKEKARTNPSTEVNSGSSQGGGSGSEDDEKGSSKASAMLMSTLPKEKLSDISGMEAAKQEVLLKVIAPIKDPDAQKYGLKAGGGLLLFGLPGTGKTFFAQAVAGELELPFYVFKSSEIKSKFVGESQQALQNLFDEARKNPMSVIFIDEIDAILPGRGSENTHSVDRELTNIILTEMSGIDSKSKNPFLLIGATNYPDNVDDAALSRFVKIEVELPDKKVRRDILKRDLHGELSQEIKVDDNAMDFLVSSTDGFSARDLVGVARTIREQAYMAKLPRITLEFCKANFVDNHVVSEDVARSIANFKKRIGVQG